MGGSVNRSRVDDLGLFLDPQMVGEGYWVWETKTPACRVSRDSTAELRGLAGGTLLLMWLLNRLPRQDVDLGVPCCSTAGCGSGDRGQCGLSWTGRRWR